jgi:serine/threonine protein kinase
VGLIHRDIKPANVFLCDRGGVPDSVKVLDFGLVKRISDPKDAPPLREVAGEHGIVGTPNFIAPEAIKDCNQSDARSDLYSLGALGYFVLTGREVFEGDSISDLCRKHLTETPISPGVRIGKPLNPVLESLILRCLEKDPANRPQSARELGQALAQSRIAETWTPERRTGWWTEYRKRAAEDTRPAVQLDSSLVDKTVKIEFADRTP